MDWPGPWCYGLTHHECIPVQKNKYSDLQVLVLESNKHTFVNCFICIQTVFKQGDAMCTGTFFLISFFSSANTTKLSLQHLDSLFVLLLFI